MSKAKLKDLYTVFREMLNTHGFESVTCSYDGSGGDFYISASILHVETKDNRSIRVIGEENRNVEFGDEKEIVVDPSHPSGVTLTSLLDQMTEAFADWHDLYIDEDSSCQGELTYSANTIEWSHSNYYQSSNEDFAELEAQITPMELFSDALQSGGAQ